MKKILVGFNGNEPSADAVHLAADWAKREGAELHVLAVFDMEPAAYFPEEQRLFFEETFSEVADQIGYPCELRSAAGVSAAHALTELADREGMDMIVIGSTHHGTVGSVLIGTVANRLLEGAPAPVLIAPRGYARSGAVTLQSIGVAFDGSPESWRALAEAKRHASTFGARVKVIAAYRVPVVTAAAPDLRGVIREGIEAEVSRALEFLGEDLAAPAVIEMAQPAELVVDQSSRLDLLVLGSRGYGPFLRVLLGSVSSHVVRHAYCPVLVIPRGDEGDEDPREFLVNRGSSEATAPDGV